MMTKCINYSVKLFKLVVILIALSAHQLTAAAEHKSLQYGVEPLLTSLNQSIDQLVKKSNASSENSTDSQRSTISSLASSLLRRADLLKSAGYYNKADRDIRQAIGAAESLNNNLLLSMATGALAELLQIVEHNSSFTGTRTEPGPIFKQSLELAESTGQAALVSVAQSRLGGWQLSRAVAQQEEADALAQAQGLTQADSLAQFGSRGRLVVASEQIVAWLGAANASLANAVKSADSTDSMFLRANARLQQAKAARIGENYNQAISLLSVVERFTRDINSDVSRTELLLTTAQEASRLPGSRASVLATAIFDRIIAMDKSAVNSRLQAAALGERAKIAIGSGDMSGGVEYIERAIQLAPESHDLAYEWEWSLGRSYREQAQPERAIAAYRRALRHVENVRSDIPISYSGGRSSFQSDFAPLYLELSDLLMLQSGAIEDESLAQLLLVEAQIILEQLKGEELQDFFRGACVIEQSSRINQFDKTAVVYPVILPQRLAILMNIGERYYHYSVPVKAETLESSVSELAVLLRDFDSKNVHQIASQRIYQWLIGTIEQELHSNDVETILFVPDGALRTIPIAALWSGQEYLIEKFEIATVPGLTLLESGQLPGLGRSALVAGLSRPGEAVLKLPNDFYAQLVPGNVDAVRGGDQTLRSVNNDQLVREGLALPSVELEVQSLAEVAPNATVLLNEDFSLANFTSQVTNSDYEIVHVASHGYFGGDVDDSWIMTHDDLLDLGQLSRLFKPKKFSDQPVELLILSACETAAGNDLAPLGLSGVALAAGARSVLGSLWIVADEATKQLMEGFYGGLGDKKTKAAALRAAQVEVLRGDKYAHPYFWAPFILVGAWR